MLIYPNGRVGLGALDHTRVLFPAFIATETPPTRGHAPQRHICFCLYDCSFTVGLCMCCCCCVLLLLLLLDLDLYDCSFTVGLCMCCCCCVLLLLLLLLLDFCSSASYLTLTTNILFSAFSNHGMQGLHVVVRCLDESQH